MPAFVAARRIIGGRYLPPEVRRIFSAMTTYPPFDNRFAIRACVMSLINAGVWQRLDALQVYAAHDQQAALLDWVRLSNATAVNSPTFTVNSNVAGNGATSYVNTQLTPSTGGLKSSQDDASMGFYVGNAAATFARNGAVSSIGVVYTYIDRTASVGAALNRDGSGTTDTTGGNTIGLKSGSRSGSSVTAFSNGVAGTPGTVASNGLVNNPIWVGGNNNNGTIVNANSAPFRAFFYGQSLDATQMLALHNALTAYSQALGLAV